MTPRYVWKTVCSDMAREDSQLLMEDMKVFIIVKSQLVPCSVCALTRPHKMRYQLLSDYYSHGDYYGKRYGDSYNYGSNDYGHGGCKNDHGKKHHHSHRKHDKGYGHDDDNYNNNYYY
ncbi:hypothetical protein GQ600_20938 [Phytophthora cactorum]|nr:hypothetical protein GQ600_20938 [Phytophthora cactorum]